MTEEQDKKQGDKKKWTVQRIHQEIAEARTKLFVVAAVLETGSIRFSDNPEWALVVTPLLKDVAANAAKIEDYLKQEESAEETPEQG
jgi:hypothetical protein